MIHRVIASIGSNHRPVGSVDRVPESGTRHSTPIFLMVERVGARRSDAFKALKRKMASYDAAGQYLSGPTPRASPTKCWAISTRAPTGLTATPGPWPVGSSRGCWLIRVIHHIYVIHHIDVIQHIVYWCSLRYRPHSVPVLATSSTN